MSGFHGTAATFRQGARTLPGEYYYSTMPNMLLGIHPDYVNYYVLTPLAPDRTRVESEWLFRSDAGGAFAPEDAVSFWDTVNRQDWDIIEQSQLGVSSRRYVPGPYSPRESISAAWDRHYLELMGQVEEVEEVEEVSRKVSCSARQVVASSVRSKGS